MSEKHRIKIHRWANGILSTTETWYEHFADAFRNAHHYSRDGHHVKIYDSNDQLVHDSHPENIHTAYASYA